GSGLVWEEILGGEFGVLKNNLGCGRRRDWKFVLFFAYGKLLEGFVNDKRGGGGFVLGIE
ncbi:hypothetical protein, partial [Siminovitchia fortis]|uniref:hypothetical protein n=1 Tax=Siminovitchia fortis TaxID=254758 RepID=UPI001C92F4CA